MSRKSPSFTVAAALKIQQDQLHGWSLRLSAHCYIALLVEVDRKNATTRALPAPTGYDVFRGTDLANFIGNWKP